MASRVPMWALGALLLALVGGGAAAGAAGKCSFPAIFNFGDSNSDTGTTFAAFNDLSLPYGMSYKENAKRYSDGRLIIDYLAENLGLPYLESPLDTIGTSYKYGANFATGGSKISPILPAWAALPIPTYLDVQISEFLQFKSRTIDFYNQLKNDSNSERSRSYMPQLPDPEDFAKALYTVDIGQNDDFYNTSLPVVIEQYCSGLQRLIQSGAKFLWLHNRGPTGCIPMIVGECRLNEAACLDKVKGYIKSENELYDQHGCVRGQNEKTNMFNRLWKQSVDKLRALYPDVVITTFDMYTAKSKIITNAQKFGFLDPFKQCCGNSTVFCGMRAPPHTGPLLGSACQDPTKYISWDGIHYSQAANKLVANLIIEGSLTNPPSTPISRACHKP